ncbi:hypothetical protein CK203_115415 [Vitis vinifera]|uniref:Uncharacterized protein n=1 Tax=Vitis vinifera TaxID=29760 RepID=A0A438D1H9_VITVI|nr:hypothetical protein CK203_115415 [Vitis vinifera]
MNFMSYVAELSRGWNKPNARDMRKMMSQPNAKGEMNILNDGIDMKAKIAAMARRLEELEMMKMQEDHPNFSWEPQPPQYQQPAQAPQQASNLEQAMVNLSKVMGDFVGAQKSINAHLSQRIDSVESSLNKKMDGVQNDLSQKIDNLQYSISRFANLNTMQEKGNFPSQPHQNSKGIHEVEAQKGESSMVKEVKTVITLRSGKEVDLPTSKLEHEVESETAKENREKIKGKKNGKSIEKDDYNLNIDEDPQRIVIKEELMMKHMPSLFLQASYGKIIQSKSQVFWMIKIKRNVKSAERGKSGVQSFKRLHVTQEVPLPPYFSIAFVTLRTMFSLVGGRVEELFDHQSNPRLRRVLWNPCKRCPDRASRHTIKGRRNMGCDRGARRVSSKGIRMELLRIATRDIAHSTRGRIQSSRHSTFSGYLTFEWERRTFQLPRSDMSGSSDRIFHILISHSRMGEEDVSTYPVRHVRIL